MNTTIDLRKKNTLVIIKAIMECEPVTKTDIAKKTGLTLMTVNTIMNSLLTRSIIAEYGVAPSNSGRKAILYMVNPDVYRIIGVNIDINETTVAVSDFNLKIRDKITLKTNDQMSPKETIVLIQQSIKDLIKKQGIKTESLLGVGVTVPGPVDEASGTIHSFPNMKGWTGIALKEILEKKLGTPVIVEKDTYASVLYLKRNLDGEYKNVVSLTIKGGIGTGILLERSLYRGENGIAGEIGHITVDMAGPRCNCGNFGCLEMYASDYAIVREVKESIRQGEKSSLPCANDKDFENIDINRIIDAALDGDELCHRIILRAARYIGIAISNAIKFYDPGYFIINSRWGKEIDGVSSVIADIVKEKCTLLQKNKMNLMFYHEMDVYLKGALKLIREYVLENIENNRLID